MGWRERSQQPGGGRRELFPRRHLHSVGRVSLWQEGELSSFPLVYVPVSVLAGLGLPGLPSLPTEFSVPRKVALDSFTSCFNLHGQLDASP